MDVTLRNKVLAQGSETKYKGKNACLFYENNT